MLHKFFEPGDWFAPKKLGYGSGWPIAWQGWVLLLGYVALVFAIGLFMDNGDVADLILGVTGIALVSIPFLISVKRRTKGGWKHRS